ncbi:aquaporin-11-like isoform X2 [Hydra vulgaris]|uniref:Aquaporin-11-like isoform X2 n=1 Tax=Hydra vulgaris TaxID=6087 RepID=A0ABM4CTZ2_HYDVU
MIDSLAYFFTPAAAIFLVLLVYLFIHQFTKSKSLIRYYGEFVGTFLSCVCILEINIINAIYGSTSLYGLCSAYFHLFFKNIFFVKTKLHGSPLAFIDLFYVFNRKFHSKFEIVFMIFIQLIASLSGFGFTRFFWVIVDQKHISALEYSCNSSLSSSYAWQYGVLMEAMGVFACVFIDLVTPNILKYFVRPSMTLILIHFFGDVTGMWMNPVLATTHTFRCLGHQSDWQHFAVYWLGPVLGLLMVWEIKLLVKSYLKKDKKE